MFGAKVAPKEPAIACLWCALERKWATGFPVAHWVGLMEGQLIVIAAHSSALSTDCSQSWTACVSVR